MQFFLVLVLWLAATANGVVIQPVANLYSAATEQADVVTQAIYGSNVTFLEEQDGWVKVRTPDDYTGWMPLVSLRRVPAEGRPYATTGRVAQVESLFANLYQETDVTKHRPLLTVPFETRLEVVAEPDTDARRWLQVRLPDERTAWVQRGDVAFRAEPRSIPETIELAKRFLGLAYLWGGTSSYGYDCSGFAQMLYRQRGIQIPRDTGPQSRWDGFVPVKRSKLKPGDLLFFGRSEAKVSHAGMYIGGGKFIHATTHERPMVQVSRLNDAYWTRLFVAARRPK
jgi:cell wall-associated NlpC family hydrolase